MRFVQVGCRERVRRRHYLAVLLLILASVGALRASSIPTFHNYDEAYHYALSWKNPNLDQCVFQGHCASVFDAFYSSGLASGPRGGIYYLLQGIFMRGLPSWMEDPDRVIIARLISVMMHGLSVWATYCALRELFHRSFLAVLLAASFAILIPSLSDIGAGINLETPAALIGSLTLYTSALILKRGLNWRRVIAVSLELVIGYTLKGTIWPIFIIVPFIFWLKLSRRHQFLLSSLAAISLAVGGLWYTQPFWSGVADWFLPLPRSTPGWYLLYRTDHESIVGKYSLQTTTEGLSLSSTSYSYNVPDTVTQYIPPDVLSRLRGRTITFGVWARAADGEATAETPHCESDVSESVHPLVLVSQKWTFHFSKYQVPPQAKWLRCALGMPQPFRSVIWYDGMILAEGEYLEAQPIVYSDMNGSQGVWSGKPFINLLQNPSAENAWRQVNPFLGFLFPVNQRIVSFLSWKLTGSSWLNMIRWSLVSFWATFGGEQPGLSPRQMIPFAGLTLVAFTGIVWIAIYDLPRQREIFSQPISRYGFWMLVVATVAIALLIIYRADIVPFREVIFDFSSMRHASAGWSAICALLALGILRWVPKQYQRLIVSSLIIALFLVNMHIFLRVQLPLYNCSYNSPEPGGQSCLWLLPLE